MKTNFRDWWSMSSLSTHQCLEDWNIAIWYRRDKYQIEKYYEKLEWMNEWMNIWISCNTSLKAALEGEYRDILLRVHLVLGGTSPLGLGNIPADVGTGLRWLWLEVEAWHHGTIVRLVMAPTTLQEWSHAGMILMQLDFVTKNHRNKQGNLKC